MKESEIEKYLIINLKRLGGLIFKIPNELAYKRADFQKLINKGAPDLVCIFKNGDVIFIELKSEKGKQSERQKYIENEIKKRNGIYILLKGMKEVENFIKNLEEKLKT